MKIIGMLDRHETGFDLEIENMPAPLSCPVGKVEVVAADFHSFRPDGEAETHQGAVDGTEFDVIKKPNAGKTVYYTGCTVESISDSNQDGDSSRKISLAVLDRTER